jgi:DNA-binding LacI/PurR family transcriptional regulator
MLKILSIPEQIANYVQDELAKGRWSGELPGRFELAKQLGVGITSMEAALRQLERDRVLASQGCGRMRRIVAPGKAGKTRSLNVKVLLYESTDRGLPDEIELLARLREAGHVADHAPKSMHDLGMRVEKVARFVRKNPADAWVVSSGSREIVEWFSNQSTPAFANYGRFSGLRIAAASARKLPALATALHRMVELGHRNIVMLAREERRKPAPGFFEKSFLTELEALGLQTGPYNLPHWDDHPAGLRICLDSLFQHTPPTALIIGEIQVFQAVQQYLARRGISIPERVSLLCTFPDLTFEWCDPVISHINWASHLVIRRIVGWANNVAKGKADLRQTFTQADFINGGTIRTAKQR